MSKIGNTILFLSYLQNGKKYSIKELAEKLEVSERMVRNYKELLENSGFYIETIRGPYGGYYLPKRVELPKPSLKEQDLDFLKSLEKKNLSEREKEQLNRIIEKIRINIIRKDNPELKEEKNKYNLFSKAIKEHLKVKINYESTTKEITERIIEPYDLFYFQNSWGVTAFCEKRKDLRNFELKRIKEAIVLQEKF